MKHKSLRGLKITDAEEGRVQAIFATLNVIDSDGDVTVPGAFEKGAEVRVSAYNHASWQAGQLPVGKGTIREEGEHAILDAQFFMDTTHGHDTFTVIKQLGDLGEWSYGYDVLDGEPGQKDGRDVKFLKSLKVHEVSPVILGAGVGTRTLAVKSIKEMLEEKPDEVAPELLKLLKGYLKDEPEKLAAELRSMKLVDHTEFILKMQEDLTLRWFDAMKDRAKVSPEAMEAARKVSSNGALRDVIAAEAEMSKEWSAAFVNVAKANELLAPRGYGE